MGHYFASFRAQCPVVRLDEQKRGVRNSGGESSVLLQLVRYTKRAACPQKNQGAQATEWGAGGKDWATHLCPKGAQTEQKTRKCRLKLKSKKVLFTPVRWTVPVPGTRAGNLSLLSAPAMLLATGEREGIAKGRTSVFWKEMKAGSSPLGS